MTQHVFRYATAMTLTLAAAALLPTRACAADPMPVELSIFAERDTTTGTFRIATGVGDAYLLDGSGRISGETLVDLKMTGPPRELYTASNQVPDSAVSRMEGTIYFQTDAGDYLVISFTAREPLKGTLYLGSFEVVDGGGVFAPSVGYVGMIDAYDPAPVTLGSDQIAFDLI